MGLRKCAIYPSGKGREMSLLKEWHLKQNAALQEDFVFFVTLFSFFCILSVPNAVLLFKELVD